MVAAADLPLHIAARIVAIRGTRVILDSDLAQLYGVKTKALLQAIRRNQDRFPSDFLIRLDNQDLAALRSQSVTSKPSGRGGRRYAISAFTEHGAVMAATVLNSPRAIAVSIYVVRAFVHMRNALMQDRELRKRLDELERRLEQRLGVQDRVIGEILEAIHQLVTHPEPTRKPGIGFVR